jgi:hypothetical protein
MHDNRWKVLEHEVVPGEAEVLLCAQDVVGYVVKLVRIRGRCKAKQRRAHLLLVPVPLRIASTRSALSCALYRLFLLLSVNSCILSDVLQ